jgi:hypothetical protein
MTRTEIEKEAVGRFRAELMERLEKERRFKSDMSLSMQHRPDVAAELAYAERTFAELHGIVGSHPFIPTEELDTPGTGAGNP